MTKLTTVKLDLIMVIASEPQCLIMLFFSFQGRLKCARQKLRQETGRASECRPYIAIAMRGDVTRDATEKKLITFGRL